MTLHVQRIDVAAVVGDAADLYADVAEAKGVRLVAHTAEPIAIAADPNRVAQAVANLLDNAIKYTPPGGRVTARLVDDTDEAIITVADTGIGITTEELPRIWDRLFRGDRSRSERGLGLGLSLVKAIAERHGGRVEAVSSPGSGSTFTLRLPKTRGPNMTPV